MSIAGPAYTEGAVIAPVYEAKAIRSGIYAFRTLYWALVPLLAIAAYATALRVGFLAEDFLSLDLGRLLGFDPRIWLPGTLPDYRPVGDYITFVAGWQLWGANPLPYHVMGLLVHAGVALLLGLWLAEVTSQRYMGLLAGTLFAVFPIHTEAVSWVAAYYDIWAPFFVLASLLLFIRWWRAFTDEGRKTKDERRRTKDDLNLSFVLRPSSFVLRPYLLSLLLYACAIFTKESVFAFLPVFGLSAWLVTPGWGWRDFRRVLVALVPFGAVLAFNVGLRLAYFGNLGGYRNARLDLGEFFVNGVTGYARLLLAPVNPALLGDGAVWVVGACSAMSLIVGLALYGRRQWRILLVALAWVGLALLPVLNLPVLPDDLRNNRYLYFVAAGYCVGVAALLYAAIQSAHRWRRALIGAVGVIVVLFIALAWVQLRPWHTASVQVEDIVGQLARDVPPQRQPEGTAWFIQNTPGYYKGAMVFRRGIGRQRAVYFQESIKVTDVADATNAPIAAEGRDAFALRFVYDKTLNRFPLDYITGVTHASAPPDKEQASLDFQVWDFRNCWSGSTIFTQSTYWPSPVEDVRCERGKGLVMTPYSDHPYLDGPRLDLSPASYPARWVRLRVAARFPDLKEAGHSLGWSWDSASTPANASTVQRTPIRADGNSHVYWSFIHAADVGSVLYQLHLAPIDAQTPIEVQWIALDLLP